MTETRKLRVFLCHSSNDKPVVRQLYQRLLAEDWVDPWLDEKKLLPGQDWDLEIEKAVKAADAVVVCLSNNSVTKEGYVQKELRSVLDLADYKPEGTIFIIPLRLENCELPRRLTRLQYVDYFPVKSRNLSYNRLLASLKNRNENPLIKSHETIKQPFTIRNRFALAITILVGIVIFAGLISSRYFSLNSPTPEPTLLSTATDLPIPTPLATNTVAPTESLPPVAGSTMVSQVDGMMMHYVPSGEFEMGNTNGFPDEEPVHTVSLDAFWIGQTEVTNAMYSSCIDDKACSALSRSDYYSRDASSPDYPVVFVSWFQANDYCEWIGGRLPTEAEWEFAARGTDDRIYPWGNQFACGRGNFDDETSEDERLVSGGPNCDGYQYLSPVGQFTNGASPFGALDMSGNVWEWVSDWYGEYKASAVTNPTGPTSGSRYVVRGGAWLNDQDMYFRTSNRYSYPPNTPDDNTGFRCVLPEN